MADPQRSPDGPGVAHGPTPVADRGERHPACPDDPCSGEPSAAPGEPRLIGAEPPPVRRDRVLHTWILASTLSRVGDAAFLLAVTWTAVHLMSPAAAGLVVTAELLPQALLTVVGGTLADRRDTRVMLLAGWAARIAILLAAAVAWGTLPDHRPVLLLAVAAGFGVVAGLTMPASATYTRQLVRTDDLGTVGGWNQIGSRLATLAGAPLGAVLVEGAGLPTVLLLDAATFALLAVVLLVLVRPRYALPRTTAGSWTAAARSGLSYLATTPPVRALAIGLLGLNAFVTPALGIGVSLRAQESGWGASWAGLAEATFAVAAIAGAVVGIRWQGCHLARRGFAVLVAQGAGIALAGAPVRPAVLAGMTVIGLTSGAASVWLGASFVRAVDPGHLGRVASLTQLGDLLLLPLAAPLYGAIAGAASPQAAALAFGAGMSLLCLSVLARPAIRDLA